jgi:transcriptional regulator with XRE-family HTH domain
MKEKEAHELGRLVKEARLARNMSLRDLGTLSGVSYRWIGRLEHGEAGAPTSSKMTRVAEALSLSPERIDRIMDGQIANDLPQMRTYFRTKYRLTPSEITQIEELFDQVRRNRPHTPKKKTDD